MARIFITGDTHGEMDLMKFNPHRFRVQEDLTKEDYVIIAGDVAVLWDGFDREGNLKERDQRMVDYYEKKPWTTLFIDGNHENHRALMKYPVTEWNGGKVHRISDSVIHLMRGQVFTIDGRRFFTMGGADSVDKMYRVEGRSWWPEEMPVQEEYEEALKNLYENDMSVDYVVTHCCGSSILRRLFTMHSRNDMLTDFFDRLEYVEKLRFSHWYFGHHHTDEKLDDRHTCLYDGIVEV